jgi:hypothetical protein
MKFVKEYKDYSLFFDTKNISLDNSSVKNYKTIITNFNDFLKKFKIKKISELDTVMYKVRLSPISTWLNVNAYKRDLLYYEFIKNYNLDIDNISIEKNYILFCNLPRDNKIFNQNAYDINAVLLSRIDQGIRLFMQGFSKHPKQVKNILSELDINYENMLSKIDKINDDVSNNYLKRIKGQ